MPRKRSEKEIELSEEIGSVRNDLSMHRVGLLDFLNRVGYEIVDLDNDRIIRKTHVISSKRITVELMLQILEKIAAQLQGCSNLVSNKLEVIALARQLFIEVVDKKDYKGEVLLKGSKAAKKRERDAPPIVPGGRELVDRDTRELADSFWALLKKRDELMAESRKLKQHCAVDEPIATATVVPAESFEEESVQQRHDELPLTGEGTDAAKATNHPSTPETPTNKPKTSISKKVAYRLLERCCDVILQSQVDGDDGHLPPWASIQVGVHSLITDFFSNPDVRT